MPCSSAFFKTGVNFSLCAMADSSTTQLLKTSAEMLSGARRSSPNVSIGDPVRNAWIPAKGTRE